MEETWLVSRLASCKANALNVFIPLLQQGRLYARYVMLLWFLTCPLNPEHTNFETQFVSLAPQLNSKWLNGFLHVLRKYIYDLFNVFRRKWLNLLYTDFNLHLAIDSEKCILRQSYFPVYSDTYNLSLTLVTGNWLKQYSAQLCLCFYFFAMFPVDYQSENICDF